MSIQQMAAGFVIGEFIGPVVSAFVGPTLGPATRERQYEANVGFSNLVPSVEELMRMIGMGLLDEETAKIFLKKQGVATSTSANSYEQNWFRQSDPDITRARLWERLVQANKPRLPLDFAFGLKFNHNISDADLETQARLQGITSAEATKLWRLRHSIGSYDNALEQYFLDRVGGARGYTGHSPLDWHNIEWTKTTDNVLGLARGGFGFSAEDARYFSFMTDAPALGQTLQLWISNRIGESDARNLMAAAGTVKGHIQDLYFVAARDATIPPISDLIRYQVKEAFSFDIARDHRLYDEYPAAIDQYAERKGIAERTIDIPAGIVDGDKVSWSQVEWAAHWNPISPTQAYEMVHRLRPEKIAELEAELRRTVEQHAAAGSDEAKLALQNWRPLRAFTSADVIRWLRVNDYPPTIRNALAAVAYRILTRIDVRKLINSDLIGQVEAIGMYQDMGYTLTDAQRLYQIALVVKNAPAIADQKRRRRAALGVEIKAVTDLFVAGGISFADAFKELAPHFGGEFEAMAHLRAHMRAERVRSFKAALDTLRRSWIGGAIAPEALESHLAAAGVVGEQVQILAEEWRNERTHAVRAESVSTIQRWVSEGHLDPEEARLRLKNLGHSDPDVAIYAQEAQQKAVALRGRMLAADDRDRHRRATELARHRREALAASKAAEHEIRRLTPVSVLTRWLRHGTITERGFRQRMAAAGYDEDAINGYIMDAKRAGADGADPEEVRTEAASDLADADAGAGLSGPSGEDGGGMQE